MESFDTILSESIFTKAMRFIVDDMPRLINVPKVAGTMLVICERIEVVLREFCQCQDQPFPAIKQERIRDFIIVKLEESSLSEFLVTTLFRRFVDFSWLFANALADRSVIFYQRVQGVCPNLSIVSSSSALLHQRGLLKGSNQEVVDFSESLVTRAARAFIDYSVWLTDWAIVTLIDQTGKLRERLIAIHRERTAPIVPAPARSVLLTDSSSLVSDLSIEPSFVTKTSITVIDAFTSLANIAIQKGIDLRALVARQMSKFHHHSQLLFYGKQGYYSVDPTLSQDEIEKRLTQVINQVLAQSLKAIRQENPRLFIAHEAVRLVIDSIMEASKQCPSIQYRIKFIEETLALLLQFFAPLSTPQDQLPNIGTRPWEKATIDGTACFTTFFTIQLQQLLDLGAASIEEQVIREGEERIGMLGLEARLEKPTTGFPYWTIYQTLNKLSIRGVNEKISELYSTAKEKTAQELLKRLYSLPIAKEIEAVLEMARGADDENVVHEDTIVGVVGKNMEFTDLAKISHIVMLSFLRQNFPDRNIRLEGHKLPVAKEASKWWGAGISIHAEPSFSEAEARSVYDLIYLYTHTVLAGDPQGKTLWRNPNKNNCFETYFTTKQFKPKPATPSTSSA